MVFKRAIGVINLVRGRTKYFDEVKEKQLQAKKVVWDETASCYSYA